MTPKNRIAKSIGVTSLLGLGLASCAGDATAERIPLSIDNARILVACPAQTDVFAGMSPKMDWSGFAERDLLLFKLRDNNLQLVSNAGRRSVSERDVEQVIRMSDCRPNDTYVLIGKDGGVKRRWSGQLVIDDLYATIDAMPMRQFEMRQKR